MNSPTNPPQYSIELTLSTLMLAVMRLRNTYKYDEVAPKPFNDEMDIAYHKAETELNQLIYTQVLEELERLHRTNGADLPKRDYDNITDEEIDLRMDEIKAKYIGQSE